MKTIKKLMTLVLSIAMVLAMGVTAFAAEGTTTPQTTYTITAPATSHQYEIYQIFTGDLSGTTLSNVKWGVNGTGTTGSAVSEKILNELKDVNSLSNQDILTVVKKHANLVKAENGNQPVATITNGGTYSAAAGYYLIKDADGTVTGDDSYTTYLVKVVGDVDITPKSAVPSFEKKIKDTNDTRGDVSGWQDSADYDIGDAVPFQLKGTVASNYAEYSSYYFAFHDVEETGLTFNSDTVKVYVDGTEIKDGYSVTKETSDGCSFEVIFSNLKNIQSVTANSVITVEYTSTLNEHAVIGNRGNVNKARLEFSNNPNSEQGGETGKTPWDNVIVFTYKLEVNKVDEKGDALPGAAFELKKKVKTTNENGESVDTYVRVALINATENNGKYTLSDDNQTKFTWSGIDDGTYELSEVITPSGYNTIAPITFTVAADHTITWNDEERTKLLTSLTGSVASGEITFAPNEDKSSLSTNVVNKSGSTLPSTGGMGTTIFYVVGTILVLAAVVLLITKKRMHADK